MTMKSIDQTKALIFSSLAFTICFAVWTIFSILGPAIKDLYHLSSTQLGLLAGTPILVGSLIRLMLGIWADQFGGRIVFFIVMIAGSFATATLALANTYETYLLAALGVGIAGGSFSVGITYVSKWYRKEDQGLALGIFGAGNVGSAVTKLAAPSVLLIAGIAGTALIWAGALFIMGMLFFLMTKNEPDLVERKAKGVKPVPFLEMLSPLKNLQVWRFSLYYFFVFGGFVALTLWLPNYLITNFGFDKVTAGLIGALFSIPGSIFRILGGKMSDSKGARRVMRLTFIGSIVCLIPLMIPSFDLNFHTVVKDASGKMAQGLSGFSLGSLSIIPFAVCLMGLGFFMAIGKAAVYKHIPVYYPDRVGSVGGIVGLIGGLGGFLLPLLFGVLYDATGVATTCFILLFLLAGVSLLLMNIAIQNLDKKNIPELKLAQDVPGFPKG